MRFYLICILISIALHGSGQVRRCGTNRYMQKLHKENDMQYSKQQRALQNLYKKMNAGTTITIPVVFHILYNNASQNIADEKIIAQVEVLNRDFAGLNADSALIPLPFKSRFAKSGIQFCLALQDENGNPTNGIIRKQTSAAGFSIDGPDPKNNADGGDRPWDAEIYLNIYSCFITNDYLGYTQLPGGSPETDGIVLDYRVVGGPNSPGSMPPYHLGRTATHEAGHWLGLYHIWGDDDGACTGNDYVDDTPNQAFENYGCPVFPHVSCGNVPEGDMFINYMDYTNDACMKMFTPQQVQRMYSALNSFRKGIPASPACTLPCSNGILEENSIKIKPNPSSGIFDVEIEYCKRTEVNILLINAMGKIILNSDFLLNYTRLININLTHNGSGLYILLLTSGKEKITRKIIVL